MPIERAEIKSDFRQNFITNGLTSKQKWALAAAAICSIASTVLLFVGSIATAGPAIRLGFGILTILGGLSIQLLATDYTLDQVDLSRFERGREGTDVFDKDILLILTAKKDFNGALQSMNAATLTELKNQTKYVVVCRRVESASEMCQAIQQMKNQRNRIQGLWIHAHGDTNSFQLGEEKPSTYYVSNTSPEWRSFSLEPLRSPLSLLEKNATIVLQSCSTGKVRDKQTAAIAQTIADLAPQTTVYAPIDSSTNCLIESLTPLKVKLYNGKKNITACFKAYPR